MSWRRAGITLLLLGILSAEAKKPVCTFRLHAEGNPHDGPRFSKTVRLPSGHQATIAMRPVLAEPDIVGVRTYRLANGSHAALITLNPHGRLALDTLSIERRGQRAFVFLNGRFVTELMIDRRVSDGKIYLPGGLTDAEVALMQKAWGKRKRNAR